MVPVIKEMIEAKKLDRLVYFATVAVRAANQTMTPEQWQEKKESVTEYLQGVLCKIHLNVNEDDLDRIIEGIVNEVKEEAAKG